MISLMPIIEFCNVVFGVLLNSLLLFLIFSCSKPSLGNYKNLLIIFACNDVTMLVLHGIVKPASFSSGSALGVFSREFPNDTHFIAICSGFMTLPFSLMNINFLHRFWSVRRSHKVALFSRPSFAMPLSLYPILMAFLWYCCSISLAHNRVGMEIIQHGIADLREIEIGKGWLILHFWENDKLHVRGLITLLIGGGIIFFKILRALFAQSVIPIFFVAIPSGVGVSLPLFVDGGYMKGLDLWFPLISSFPMFDAIVIIMLMKDYREGLIRMLVNREDNSLSTVRTTFTLK